MRLESILEKIIKYLPIKSKRNYQVIYFHEVTKENGKGYDFINVHKFEKQMKYLYQNNYQTLTFEDLNNQKKKINKKMKNILITFDDGYINNYKLVYPIMKKYGLKFNIFIEAGAINKKDNYLSWEMINEMASSKLVGFGAHTYNHVDARYIKESTFQKEIVDTNELINQKTNLKVEDFCFPYGLYDSNIIELLTKSKEYKRLYTSDGIKYKHKDSVTTIGRVGIKNEDDLKTFIGKVKGKYNFFYSLNRKIKSKKKGYLNEVSR